MTPEAVADELDAIFAAPVQVTVRGERVMARGVRLDELPAFLRLYARQQVAGALEETAGWEEMLALFAKLCDRPVEWLVALEEGELGRIFAAVEAANSGLIGAGGLRAGLQAGGGKPLPWAVAVAQLVERGHALEAVRGYTLGQVERLLQAHARLSADTRLDELTLARAAQADRKGFKGAVEALEHARKALE